MGHRQVVGGRMPDAFQVGWLVMTHSGVVVPRPGCVMRLCMTSSARGSAIEFAGAGIEGCAQ
jgi:hypothetical protein